MKLNAVWLEEVRWDKVGIEIEFFWGKGNADHHLGTRYYVQLINGVISIDLEVRLTGSWSDGLVQYFSVIVTLNVTA
jgi:hypothetical protein